MSYDHLDCVGSGSRNVTSSAHRSQVANGECPSTIRTILMQPYRTEKSVGCQIFEGIRKKVLCLKTVMPVIFDTMDQNRLRIENSTPTTHICSSGICGRREDRTRVTTNRCQYKNCDIANVNNFLRNTRNIHSIQSLLQCKSKIPYSY